MILLLLTLYEGLYKMPVMVVSLMGENLIDLDTLVKRVRSFTPHSL